MIFFTSIGWAGYQVSVRYTMQNVDSRAAFGMVAVLTSSALLVNMFAFGRPSQFLHLPPHVIVLVLLSGIVGLATAHFLFYVAIKQIGVAIASSTNLASALLTAVLSRILFQEALTLTQWMAGMGLLCGGLLLTRAQIHLKRS
jgi:drug/metabolite transporter (DMT)-like permease